MQATRAPVQRSRPGSAILVFVGGKMLLADFYKIPVGLALGVIAGILIISVIASLAFPRRDAAAE